MRRLMERLWLGLAIASLALAAGNTPGSEAGIKPDIVLILTDDQAFHEMVDMPQTRALIGDAGTTFDATYIVNPLCCPSRATILTGRTSGQTDVWDNAPPDGGWSSYKLSGLEKNDLPLWLQAAGYQTSLVGKYLNGYTPANTSYVPKGWSDWHALAMGTGGTDSEGQGGYYGYYTSDNGVQNYHGTTEADYSTTVLGVDAARFIENADPAKPLFLYFAPRAPHGPATPEAKYASAPCPTSTAPRDVGFNEADVSDKPAYIQARKLVGLENIDGLAASRCRTLLSVDDAVATIVGALRDSGRLDNSLILFMSDNGYLLGAHRWNGKTVPYEEAIHVPMLLRWDGHVAAGAHSAAMVSNLDVAEVLADAAGVTVPGAGGVDFLAGGSRSELLLEHQGGGNGVPAYCGVHTARFDYVQYDTGEQELYDLNADPSEVQNLADDPAYAARASQLHDDAMALCVPLPPGWSLP
jgi:arylsulfatase A-like enzyme